MTLKVKVNKLTDDAFDGEHPNGILEGSMREGVAFLGVPVVDRSFNISYGSKVFSTSTITEILEETESGGKFKTLNSTYSWEIIKDK